MSQRDSKFTSMTDAAEGDTESPKLRCTCHDTTDEPPRFIDREGPDAEWAHIDDETYAETAHIHVDFGGRDCDGPTGGSHIVRPLPDQDAIDMWSEHVQHMVSAHAIEGRLTVVDGTAQWREVTDEGSRYRDARLCRDPECAYERATAYDVYAEMAGY
jgi:hypothetical protein